MSEPESRPALEAERERPKLQSLLYSLLDESASSSPTDLRLRKIINGIAEGVAVAGKNGFLEAFNPAAQRILGAEMVEADKHQWSTLYGLYLPDGTTPCPIDELPLARALQGEYVEEIPLVVHQSNLDRIVNISVTASPLYDDNGNIDGAVAIFQDVTERVQALRMLEEARRELELRVLELQASERKYQDLYENAPDMYATIDAATLTIVDCNQTLTATTGFHKDDLSGTSVIDLHSGNSKADVIELFINFNETGEIRTSELELRRKDGRYLDVSLGVSAIRDVDQRIVLARCVWRDITRRKRTEESLQHHRNELAHMTRVQTAGEMATGLAHELNQPLNAISNYAHGLARRAVIGKPFTEDLLAATECLIRESERASSIIDGLRRLVAKQTPAQEVADLNSVIEEALLICQGETRRHQVAIERNLSDNLPHPIIDIVQIKQVVMCLVLNSIEALIAKPSELRSIRIATTSDADSMVKVHVEDNGVGFDATTASQIFDAFYSTKESGMGMGLAISRSIVEKHGGRIWAKSRAEGGAEFGFSLPAQ